MARGGVAAGQALRFRERQTKMTRNILPGGCSSAALGRLRPLVFTCLLPLKGDGESRKARIRSNPWFGLAPPGSFADGAPRRPYPRGFVLRFCSVLTGQRARLQNLSMNLNDSVFASNDLWSHKLIAESHPPQTRQVEGISTCSEHPKKLPRVSRPALELDAVDSKTKKLRT